MRKQQRSTPFVRHLGISDEKNNIVHFQRLNSTIKNKRIKLI